MSYPFHLNNDRQRAYFHSYNNARKHKMIRASLVWENRVAAENENREKLN